MVWIGLDFHEPQRIMVAAADEPTGGFDGICTNAVISVFTKHRQKFPNNRSIGVAQRGHRRCRGSSVRANRSQRKTRKPTREFSDDSGPPDQPDKRDVRLGRGDLTGPTKVTKCTLAVALKPTPQLKPCESARG